MDWKYKLKIRDLIDEGLGVAEIYKQMNNRIQVFHEQHPEVSRCQLFQDCGEAARDFNKIEILDDAIDHLYDWADKHRIWVE